jgi:septum formation protein
LGVKENEIGVAKMALILASASPRRAEILQNLGFSFEICPSHTDESFGDGLKPAEIVELLAERKATDVLSRVQEGIIIGSDTIVVLEGKVFGKPSNKDDALWMLTELRGKTHSVFSGLAVLDALTGEKKIGHIETKVQMRNFSDLEMNCYIQTGEPMDKAGGYAIQGIGSIFIEKIIGDYFSVVGMPVSLLVKFLAYFGISVFKSNRD